MPTIVYRLSWPGTGFGNQLTMAHLTRILNDNGISAVFNPHKPVLDLVDVPIYDPSKAADYIYRRYQGEAGLVGSTWTQRNCDMPALFMYLQALSRKLKTKITFDPVRHNHIPVLYKDRNQPKVDVAICTKTGPWAPCRDWPHFPALKKLFDKQGISYIDINERGLRGFDCLDVVAKAKVYLGLETGTSHYVSKKANNKGLIIQGGFSPFYYWAAPYDYEAITTRVHCEHRPCFLDRVVMANGVKCPYNYSCISAISPEQVFTAVKERV